MLFPLVAAFAAVLSAALLRIPVCGAAADAKKPTYYTFCFWDRFSQWRPAPYNFDVTDIPAELCNAVIYSHVTIDDKTGLLKLTSQELKLDPDARTKASSFFYNWKWLLPPHSVFAQIKQLKHRNPNLKILLAVGGPQDPAEKYWKYFQEIHLWKDTAASLAQWLRTYDFDGVVFDFFSGSSTIDDSPRTWDQAKLIHPFLREINMKFMDYPQNWRIALTIPAFDSTTHHLFDIKRLNQVVNFFILKTRDCTEFPRGAGLNVTRRLDMSDIERAEFLVEKGALRQRIVLDIPFSGKTYTATGSGVATVFKGHSGPYTKEQGSLAFFEVCDHIKAGWKRERYGEEACSFLNLGNEYVAYEDEQSIRRKARMVMGRQYRGAAVRTVDMDDITGSCTRKSYLLKALRDQLDESSYYVHFYYRPSNTTGWNKTDDSDWRGPNGSFTHPALTYPSSIANPENDATTPIPPKRRVQDGPGVPERWKPFLPGFYARTSSSTEVASSTAKAIVTSITPYPRSSDDIEWLGPNGSFTHPASTYLSSIANPENDSTTPITPTTRVQDGPGVPERWKPFLPGFYARTSTSIDVSSSTSKAIVTSITPDPRSTANLDDKDQQPPSYPSSPESQSENPRVPGDFILPDSNETELSSATLNDTSSTTTPMSEKLPTAKIIVSPAQQESTLPDSESALETDISTPHAEEPKSSHATELTPASAKGKMATSSTTKPVTIQTTNNVRGSQMPVVSLTPTTPRTPSTNMPAEVPSASTKNTSVSRAVTKESTSSTMVTMNYPEMTSESGRNICENEDTGTLLPHETDCDKFYQCVYSIPHLKSCPPNTVFDIARQTCNWPNIANRVECIF